MIIFDNIILAIQNSGGISVRWKELMQTISKDKLVDESYFVMYNCSDRNLYYNEIAALIPKNRIISRKGHFLSRVIDFKINMKDKFIFHSSYYRVSSNKNAINVLMFHDCIQEFHGSGIKNTFAIRMKKRAVSKASHIICNSYTTKKDLMSVYNYPEKNISVIYSGVSPNFHKLEGIHKTKYLLFIGSRAPYKRFDFAIELLKINPDLKLRVVGGGSFSKSELKMILSVNERVEHLVGIDEIKLNEIYNSSLALIHASSYEGFGVPVIEAMKSGCPVIAYNCPVVKEIAREGVIYFNEYNALKVNVLISKLDNENFRNTLTKKAMDISKSFSWEQTGLQTIVLFKSLLLK